MLISLIKRIKIKKSIVMASFIPLISLLVSVWAVYKYNDDLGPIIHVEFTSAEGVEEGKTLLKYHGIPVGKVIKLEVSKDLRKVDFIIRLVKNASHVAHSGAKFWIVRPKAGINGLENLETIVSGDYIAVDLPKYIDKHSRGFNQCHFIGHEKKSKNSDAAESDFIVKVKMPHVFSPVMVGSPVLYKGYVVGLVEDMNLPEHGKNILLTVNVREEYAHLLRSNTIFWNLKSFDIDWKLLKGFKLKTTSNPLKTLLVGGIGFSTPPYAGSEIKPGHMFSIHPEFNEDWLYWEPNIPQTKLGQNF